MYSLIQKRKSIAIVIIAAFSALSIISAPARATMVGTVEILKQTQHDLSRNRIKMFLDRSFLLPGFRLDCTQGMEYQRRLCKKFKG